MRMSLIDSSIQDNDESYIKQKTLSVISLSDEESFTGQHSKISRFISESKRESRKLGSSPPTVKKSTFKPKHTINKNISISPISFIEHGRSFASSKNSDQDNVNQQRRKISAVSLPTISPIPTHSTTKSSKKVSSSLSSVIINEAKKSKLKVSQGFDKKISNRASDIIVRDIEEGLNDTTEDSLNDTHNSKRKVEQWLEKTDLEAVLLEQAEEQVDVDKCENLRPEEGIKLLMSQETQNDDKVSVCSNSTSHLIQILTSERDEGVELKPTPSSFYNSTLKPAEEPKPNSSSESSSDIPLNLLASKINKAHATFEIFASSKNIIERSTKRKLYNPNDLSYLETSLPQEYLQSRDEGIDLNNTVTRFVPKTSKIMEQVSRQRKSSTISKKTKEHNPRKKKTKINNNKKFRNPKQPRKNSKGFVKVSSSSSSLEVIETNKQKLRTPQPIPKRSKSYNANRDSSSSSFTEWMEKMHHAESVMAERRMSTIPIEIGNATVQNPSNGISMVEMNGESDKKINILSNILLNNNNPPTNSSSDAYLKQHVDDVHRFYLTFLRWVKEYNSELLNGDHCKEIINILLGCTKN